MEPLMIIHFFKSEFERSSPPPPLPRPAEESFSLPLKRNNGQHRWYSLGMIQELFRIKRTEDYYGECWKMKKEIMAKCLEKTDIKMKKTHTHITRRHYKLYSNL